ncbi:pgi1, partial [Symbiodinium sp. KB8]
MFEALLDLDVPWTEVAVWQVDERVAPDGDDARNANQLTGLAERCRVHAMPVTAADLRAAARRYAAGLPDRIDVVHLGGGDDGHTASWPPDRPAIPTSDRPVELVDEFNGLPRMTLTQSVVGAARARVVLATGERKRPMIERWLLGDDDLPITPPLAFASVTGTPPLSDLFADDPGRAERYVVEAGDLRIDYSKQPLNDDVLADLLERARDAGVESRRDAMFAGEHINVTEDRAVLHTALRAPRDAVVEADGENVVPDVHEVLDAMSAFADRVRADDRITDVVNIGIGGSDLGPAMAAQALEAFGHPRITCHFVSNVD